MNLPIIQTTTKLLTTI